MTGATLGKIAINFNKRKFLVNQRVGKFDLGEKPFQKAPYLYCTLSEAGILNEIISIGGGSAQANISSQDIENINIVIPCEDILKKFNSLGQVLLNNMSILWNENSVLQKIQRLMNSKLSNI